MPSLIDARDLAWMDKGLCKDDPQPDDWFSDDYKRVHRAKRICESCPVQARCLDYALTERIPGMLPGGKGTWVTNVWGGTTERERKFIRRGATYPCPGEGCTRTVYSERPDQHCWECGNKNRSMKIRAYNARRRAKVA